MDELEQINIQIGTKWLNRQKKNKNLDIFTEAFVCDMHKKLFGDVWKWAGSFRKTGKNIGWDAVYIGVELRNLLGDARYQVENDSLLTIALEEDPIDWAGGHDLQSMSEQRTKYIAALRSADAGDYEPLLNFVDA